MYRIARKFRVPIAHRLSKNERLCKFIHGHNITIQVCVRSEVLNDKDMIIDFTDLKEVVNSVLSNWDHSLFLNHKDVENVKKLEGNRIVQVGGDPTAETLSKYLFTNLSSRLSSGVELDSIRIWENEDSYAEYSRK